jgi:hypothetical protein
VRSARLARRALALLALCAVLAPGRPVRADEDDDGEDVVVRKFAFAERGKKLVVSLSFTDVFDGRLLDELDSGFATTLVLRAYVYPADEEGALPVEFAVATLRVVYDLWAENYQVQIDDARGKKKFTEATLADALKRVTTLVEFPVANLKRIKIGKNYFVAVIIEVNPVSEELLAEVRRWLARDAGQTRPDDDSSFFGSFVSIFVNPKIPVADRVLKLRSQPFYRTKR